MSKFNKAKVYIKKARKNVKYFGINLVISQILAKIIPHIVPQSFGWLYTPLVKKNYRNISRYLLKRYFSVIEKWQEVNFTNNEDVPKVIYTMWLQGIDEAPILVKKCINSIKKQNPGYKIVILDDQNILDYVKIPEFIINDYRTGKLQAAHLADVVRVNLLFQNGGIWMDATDFCINSLPDELIKYPFYTVKRKPLQYGMTMVNGRWYTFFLSSKKGNPMFGFLSNFFEVYYRNEEAAIDYLLIDYSIDLAMKYIPLVQKEWEKIPYNNENVFKLEKKFNFPIKSTIIEDIKSSEVFFFKLSNRDEHITEIKGKSTVYGGWLTNKLK
ncbi:capsular polysaccharide synthesis protein [Lactobacillus sp. 3B(2020)]|uniref:capsular polysaccharide synthesis protein n=1 Tax=Lactobacillus sp. 3B(2020) TaxID=2695882 RepID=UPI0015DD95A6|nr:capsular polysaccharide synthesis protein [Lactobacillus sp. 3B(2020)]QLL70091.1 hypothetical protein GTO83_05850 [Lactobacillus sp. 3B(2020)]